MAFQTVVGRRLRGVVEALRFNLWGAKSILHSLTRTNRKLFELTEKKELIALAITVIFKKVR